MPLKGCREHVLRNSVRLDFEINFLKLGLHEAREIGIRNTVPTLQGFSLLPKNTAQCLFKLLHSSNSKAAAPSCTARQINNSRLRLGSARGSWISFFYWQAARRGNQSQPWKSLCPERDSSHWPAAESGKHAAVSLSPLCQQLAGAQRRWSLIGAWRSARFQLLRGNRR